jgi:hypothetical protein
MSRSISLFVTEFVVVGWTTKWKEFPVSNFVFRLPAAGRDGDETY